MNRKNFLKTMLLGGAAVAAARASHAQEPDSLAGRGETGTLRDPYSAGRPRDRATEADNDEAVKAIEQQLKCSCGCNLDIFTCRTTDFTCETSPRLHKQVLGLYQGGFSEDQVIQQFVEQYGEQALMAPRPEGFNLAGYVVPGVVILTVGTALAWYLGRRRKSAIAESVSGTDQPPPNEVHATPEELEELRHALARDDQ